MYQKLDDYMKKQTRKLPTKHQIKRFWKDKIVNIKKDIFESTDMFDNGDYCFACGLLTNNHTEMAHIVARCSGGTDDVDNIHLLCSVCHKESEIIEGDKYFEWLKTRNHFDTILTILYKKDYELFKTVREESEKLNIDISSISFLHQFNALNKTLFSLEG